MTHRFTKLERSDAVKDRKRHTSDCEHKQRNDSQEEKHNTVLDGDKCRADYCCSWNSDEQNSIWLDIPGQQIRKYMKKVNLSGNVLDLMIR